MWTRARIGSNSFTGNLLTYPSQSKAGDNCLLATKVMVPIDGEMRQDIGLLGSPCFEIPRTVERDSRFNHLTTGDERRRRLAAKNRHNGITIGIVVLQNWFYLFVLTVILACVDEVGHDWAYGLFPVVILAGPSSMACWPSAP